MAFFLCWMDGWMDGCYSMFVGRDDQERVRRPVQFGHPEIAARDLGRASTRNWLSPAIKFLIKLIKLCSRVSEGRALNE